MKSVNSGNGSAQDTYLKLIQRFPLRPIGDDQELDEAIKLIDELLDRQLDEYEQWYLDVLSDIVEKYEHANVEIPSVPDGELLKFMIEQRGVTQAEVASKTGIVESTISAIVSGNRPLNRDHISKLSEFFGVAPGVFFGNSCG